MKSATIMMKNNGNAAMDKEYSGEYGQELDTSRVLNSEIDGLKTIIEVK